MMIWVQELLEWPSTKSQSLQHGFQSQHHSSPGCLERILAELPCHLSVASLDMFRLFNTLHYGSRQSHLIYENVASVDRSCSYDFARWLPLVMSVTIPYLGDPSQWLSLPNWDIACRLVPTTYVESTHWNSSFLNIHVTPCNIPALVDILYYASHSHQFWVSDLPCCVLLVIESDDTAADHSEHPFRSSSYVYGFYREMTIRALNAAPTPKMASWVATK